MKKILAIDFPPLVKNLARGWLNAIEYFNSAR